VKVRPLSPSQVAATEMKASIAGKESKNAAAELERIRAETAAAREEMAAEEGRLQVRPAPAPCAQPAGTAAHLRSRE